MSIEGRLRQLRTEVGEVRIVGVAKFQPVEKVREAILAGVDAIANNYAQDGQKLMEALSQQREKTQWHFIGHIQSRKVKYLVDYDCVQSLDRISIAQDLDTRLTRPLRALVEVNIGEEPQKSGVLPRDLDAFLRALQALRNVKLAGLMAMPPALEPVESRRPFFRTMRRLFEELGKTYAMDTLSMGTSEDYRIAVQEGATMIRLGTTLFGERQR